MAIYTIYRDVFTQDVKTGLWSKKIRREYLRVTKSGRYVWQDDLQVSSEFTLKESCRIMDNLQRVIRPNYNYGKVFQYGD